MFDNLGRALALLREMRGLSQMALSRRARIGKSQLSKYERGRELPKLDTLERLLGVLEVSPLSFFYTLAMLDDLLEKLDAGADRRLAPLLLPLNALHPQLDNALSLAVRQLFRLYHLRMQVLASPSFLRMAEARAPGVETPG